MHLLLFCKIDEQFLTSENIDRIISAELPIPIFEQIIRLRVLSNRAWFIYRTCNLEFPHVAYYISNRNNRPNLCSKHFLKAFREEIIL